MWRRGRARPTLGLVVGSLLAASLFVPSSSASGHSAKTDPVLSVRAASHPHARFPVIVREVAPRTLTAERLVRSLGGHVTHELPIVDGFSAVVPGAAVADLARSPAVLRVWGDGQVRMNTVDMSQYDTYPINTVWQTSINLLDALTKSLGLGVGVAQIDTGVVPVPDLVNQVSYRADFTPEHDGLDRYGHGTHMAGIIVGDGTASNGKYKGVAPGARLISVKVAGFDGSTDVSVVIAGMQWVLTHEIPLNIKVLNLSFGTDGVQPYSVDPLDFAVEQLWRAGITVVVSAGNRGPNAGTIDKPADDPYVVTVGAVDNKGTTTPYDDVVAPFSGVGPTHDGLAKPDIVAPGISIVSLRDPNSTIDQLHPKARVGTSYFKGTGTSQATAIVSGIVALMDQVDPLLTPDEVKGVLMRTATRLATQPGSGAGEVNAGAAVNAVTDLLGVLSPANVGVKPSTGTGTLEGSRGSLHVYADLNNDGIPDLVSGQVDVFGAPWTATSWSDNTWPAYAWEAKSWSDSSWSAKSWSGTQWGASSWSENSWSGNSWSSSYWSAKSWSADSWSANDWSAKSWSAKSWSSLRWN
jgi:serine protease AprX